MRVDDRVETYRVEDVARLACVTPYCVRRWAREGRLSGGRKIGKRWLWPRAAVLRALGLEEGTSNG